MTSRNHGGPTRNAGPLLATFFTFLYALVPCLFIVVAGASSHNPYTEWTFILGVFACVTLFFYLLRRIIPESVNDGSFLILRERREDPLSGYQPKKKGRRRRQRYGTQKPTSADDIRAIRDDAQKTTWVPRGRSSRD